jgi:hypothetical protein
LSPFVAVVASVEVVVVFFVVVADVVVVVVVVVVDFVDCCCYKKNTVVVIALPLFFGNLTLPGTLGRSLRCTKRYAKLPGITFCAVQCLPYQQKKRLQNVF